MNNSVFRFVLDLHSTQSQISIPVLKGDTSRRLCISLSDGGKPYFIKDGCLAKISIKRPTETYLVEFCNIERNTVIVYEFAQNANTAAVDGIHECDVTLYGTDGKVIASPRFTMIVSERVIRSDDIELTDEDYTAVDAMLTEEAKRQSNEIDRVNEEIARDLNESDRIDAERVRQNNEAARNHEEDQRNLLENSRQSAERDRDSAETTRNDNESTRIENEKERIANEDERVAKDAERDEAINNALATSGRAEKNSEEAVSKADQAVDFVTESVEGFRNEIGTDALISGQPTIKGSVNVAVNTANTALDQAGLVRTNLINLSAQVQGIGRSYVVPDFSSFIRFLDSKRLIELKEDRNGDGVPESYYIMASDLKTGDNIIITERGVPDFWFEKNSALTEFETYTYDGHEYVLSSSENGSIVGGAHILETDYSVIDGYATSAAASANDASNYARLALTSEGNAKGSEDRANASEVNAKDSENKAKESENKAKASELAAQTAQEEAKDFVNSLGIVQTPGGGETVVMSQKATSTSFSNALKDTTRGNVIKLTDISPVAHALDVKVYGASISDLSTVKVKAQGKNILPYPYKELTKEMNGVTFRTNADRSVTINGTATDGAYMVLSLDLYLGDTNLSGSVPSVSTNGTYVLSELVYYHAASRGTSISINKGDTYDNYTVYPQVELGTEPTEYEPYVGPPTEYAVNADGSVDGIVSIYPTTVLTTDTEGAVIEASYNKDTEKVIDDVNTTHKNDLDEFADCILACLEKVTWTVDDGQKYYDRLHALRFSQNAKSQIFTINDGFLKNGYIDYDGSINTTVDSEYNFYWDKFVGTYAFALLDENNVSALSANLPHRYARYDASYNFLSSALIYPYVDAVFLTDVLAPYFKLGFRNITDYAVNRALIASTNIDSLCTINNTGLNAQGEIEEFQGRISSEYIKVYDNTPILLATLSSLAILCLYDKELNLIKRQIIPPDDNYAKIIEIPEGAKYFRICTTPSSKAYTSLELQA